MSRVVVIDLGLTQAQDHTLWLRWGSNLIDREWALNWGHRVQGNTSISVLSLQGFLCWNVLYYLDLGHHTDWYFFKKNCRLNVKMADYMLSLEEFDTTTKIFNIEIMYLYFITSIGFRHQLESTSSSHLHKQSKIWKINCSWPFTIKIPIKISLLDCTFPFYMHLNIGNWQSMALTKDYFPCTETLSKFYPV